MEPDGTEQGRGGARGLRELASRSPHQAGTRTHAFLSDDAFAVFPADPALPRWWCWGLEGWPPGVSVQPPGAVGPWSHTSLPSLPTREASRLGSWRVGLSLAPSLLAPLHPGSRPQEVRTAASWAPRAPQLLCARGWIAGGGSPSGLPVAQRGCQSNGDPKGTALGAGQLLQAGFNLLGPRKGPVPEGLRVPRQPAMGGGQVPHVSSVRHQGQEGTGPQLSPGRFGAARGVSSLCRQA